MSALFCTFFLLQVVDSQVRVPDLVYAWLDAEVTLECRTNTQEETKQITWERQTGADSVTFLTYRTDTGPIYQTSYGRRVRFKGDGNKNGSIGIFNVTLEDEGVYKCVFTTFPSGNTEKTIQLQVLVLPTVRQVLIEDVRTPCLNMVAECWASSAKPPAEIQWITHGINYTSKEENITHPNGTTSTRSRLYMVSTPQYYGHKILCLVYQPKIPFQHQENVTINGALTNIQFPPQMVQIEVLKNDKEDLQLLCKAEANPKPTYYWKRGDAEESKANPLDAPQVTSPTMNFTDGDGHGLYICETENALGINRGYIYMYKSKSSPRCHLGLLISLICITCLTLCAIFLFRTRLCNKDNYKPHIGKEQSIEILCTPERERKKDISKNDLQDCGDTESQLEGPQC
ncbi:nectin-1-like [Hyla sarda]|uniref:nectin-1-like n=1 Tax=Hyla sarda TaxID=327740 RepID=UPI0024C4473D|nr:nectin-1-like [Hyla sarda]